MVAQSCASFFLFVSVGCSLLKLLSEAKNFVSDKTLSVLKCQRYTHCQQLTYYTNVCQRDLQNMLRYIG
jgi:hypothetical protein